MEVAFGDFYRRTARPLWAYVYRVTGNSADADDIVQDAFHRLLRADLPALGDEDLRRYVFGVATNLITDRWRRSAREQAGLARVRTEKRVGEPVRSDVDLAQTFGRLKPRERALLWLAYVEEEDHAHIATALGLGRGSVKVLLSRARAHLRDLLKAKGFTASTS